MDSGEETQAIRILSVFFRKFGNILINMYLIFSPLHEKALNHLHDFGGHISRVRQLQIQRKTILIRLIKNTINRVTQNTINSFVRDFNGYEKFYDSDREKNII